MDQNQNSKAVEHITIHNQIKVEELVKQFGYAGAFGAGCLAEAASIYSDMIADSKATIFTSLAGAMVPGGMRRIIRDILDLNYTDVLITTGANLTHDLVEAFGSKHYRNLSYESDTKLRTQGISRIHNVHVTNDAFVHLENQLQKLFDEISPSTLEKISSNRLLSEIGLRLNDPNSIIATAAKKRIPIFCPAITDSILGLQLMIYSETHSLALDPLADLKDLMRIAYDADTSGVLIIGGGVPKNYTLQSALVTDKSFRYAIQLTTDHPEGGGLSGATLNEAQSWGKIEPEARFKTVIADATITLPLLYTTALEHNKGRKRNRITPNTNRNGS